MWARVVEIMLACWLAISPAILHGASATAKLWTVDLATAALVATFALLSYWPPTRHAHLVTIAAALALIAAGMAPYPPAPPDQNHILVGLLLLLFAIVPNEASRPPRAWREVDERG